MLFVHFVLKSALPSLPCDILILKSSYVSCAVHKTELKKYSAAHCLAVPVISSEPFLPVMTLNFVLLFFCTYLWFTCLWTYILPQQVAYLVLYLNTLYKCFLIHLTLYLIDSSLLGHVTIVVSFFVSVYYCMIWLCQTQSFILCIPW